MSKLQDLLSQAAVIRDATEDKENTAIRVGTMFVDFIQACLDILPQLLVDGNLTSGVPGASSFTLTFHTLDGDGVAHSNSISIPIVNTTVAGLMSPSLKAELHSATSAVNNLTPRMTNAETNITNLSQLKLSYYDASWVHYSTRWNESNFNELAQALADGRLILYLNNVVHASVTANYILFIVGHYRSYRTADIWLNNGVVSVTWGDNVIFPSTTDVEDIDDRVTTLENTTVSSSDFALLSNRVTTIENNTKEVYCTMEQYQEWVDAGTIDPDTKYYIYEE